MNLFQLEYFIVLAETLSYTKASQRLHITQPALSKLIINLERAVGTQLFIRNKRDVKLTPAGKVFYEETKKVLKSFDCAIKKTKEVESGITGVINLGFLGTALIRLLPEIINDFREKNPNIEINPRDCTYSYIMDAIFRDQLDIAILPDLEVDNIPNLCKKTVFCDNMCLVVPKSHKYATLDSIDLLLIKDEPMIQMDPRVSRRDHNLINSICMTKNFRPNTIYEANSLIHMLVMVDCQVGVTIMASHMQFFANDSIRFIPINGFDRYFKVVCIHNNRTNECVQKLLDVIDSHSNNKQ